MNRLINSEDVLEILRRNRDVEFQKANDPANKYKSVIRSKHESHVAFCDYLIDSVNRLPSAEEAAQWIGEADGYWDGELVYDIWYCSNCDYRVDDDEKPTWKYCPNCGKPMMVGE